MLIAEKYGPPKMDATPATDWVDYVKVINYTAHSARCSSIGVSSILQVFPNISYSRFPCYTGSLY